MSTPQPRDPLRSQHTALIERVVLLRSAPRGPTKDHADVHRKLARARAENDALRIALSRTGKPTTKVASTQGRARTGAP